MTLPIESLTPNQIVAELDRYIVGQQAAKKSVAVALRNRYRRLQLPEEDRGDVLPKNILMIGPTGVGKTEIARRLAQLARAPFIKVEATKFTEVGYVGRDVESMVRDLAATAVRLVETERIKSAWEHAQETAWTRIAYALLDSHEADEIRKKVEELKSGQHATELIEVETEQQGTGFLQAFTPQGMEEISLDMFGGNNPFSQNQTLYRHLPVQEAFPILAEQEAKRAIDQSSLSREAVLRAEESGIIFIDEIDKVAIKSSGSGPDVSREGVQRDLLPIIEGSTVATKFGPVKTDHILFIAAGAFHMAKPSDLIPELQGRLPIRVELENLNQDDFERILTEPKNALSKQYQQLLKVDGVNLVFAPDAITEIARFAKEVNTQTENIGARRLHTIMERLLEDILFNAPYETVQTVVFDADKVRGKLGPLLDSAERVL